MMLLFEEEEEGTVLAVVGDVDEGGVLDCRVDGVVDKDLFADEVIEVDDGLSMVAVRLPDWIRLWI